MKTVLRFLPGRNPVPCCRFIHAWPALVLLLALPSARGAARQVVKSNVAATVARLEPVARLEGAKELKLAIGLPLRNQAALSQFLRQLYDPADPNFRHYLTPAEFTARFGPTEKDYEALIAFAQAHNLKVRATHPNRLLLDVSGSAADVERAFHVTLQRYQHPTEARSFYAPSTDPSLDLAIPVLGISGLSDYSLPRPRLQARPIQSKAAVPAGQASGKAPGLTGAGQTPAVLPESGSGPSGTYMGGDFRAAYAPDTALTGAGQLVGLLQFDGYAASDITYYESKAGLPNVPLINVLLDGFGGNPTGSGGEVEVCLDIETSISMAPGLSGVVVYMAGPYGNWHDILNRIANDNLAKQVSCSWYQPGGGPDAVADQIWQQMAAQGQSFYCACGDYDAFTGPVDFPDETPYIILVGGTTLTTTGPGGTWLSETVWNRNNGIGTGGGISTRYTIPAYQADIDMSLNQGSTTMRNIPDVGLTAESVYVRSDGGDWDVGGTSCAAPLWAGFTALVNQQAVGVGRPTVGFINPALDVLGHAAKYTTCFHDITTGNNTSGSSPTKFYGVSGYDLCTGWGTPAGQKLINALATPDALLVSPASLAFSGNVGGPFSPSPGYLTLTNTGTNALSWSLSNTSTWFDVSPTSGTLVPGGPATQVSVALSAATTALPAGVYPASLALTNLSSGVGQTATLALSVAAPGMADAFDSGLDLTQWSGFGGVPGSTVVATNYGGSVSAPNSLWFGAKGSRYAATVPINTTAGGQIGFCLRLANGSAWPWARVDNLPAQGVVLESSTNGGGNWTALGSYATPDYYNWTGVALPIPAVAQGPAVLFRWRQLANDGTNYDHWALDNVVVGTGQVAPKIVMDPQSQNVFAGDPASLSVAAIGTPPLNYQWSLNGTNLAGTTASSIVWTSIQLADAGTYSVSVSNSVGGVVSSNAVLAVYVPVCVPPPLNLVSWWRAEGDCLDEAGSNNGSLQSGAAFTTGRVGQAFSFNGAGAYVKVPKAPSLDVGAQVTVEFWMKADTSNTMSTCCQGLVTSDFYGIEIAESGQPRVGVDFFISTDGGHSFPATASAANGGGAAVSSGVWHHVAGTYDGSKLQLYIDGEPWGMPTPASGAISPMLASSFVSIGSEDGRTACGTCIGARYFKGLIDEPSIYNRALSAGEIAAIYNARSAGKCATPSGPTIYAQPADQAVLVGADATFVVQAAGTLPLSYQWLFDGTNITGATSSLLSLADIQMAQAGTYAVQVTNFYGHVLSSNAVLSVQPVTPCVSPASGLLSWWAGEGNALDSLGTNNGVLMNGASFGAGEVGQAFSFNGAGAYVKVPKAPNLDVGSQVTVEFWMKADPSNPMNNCCQGLVTSDFYGIEIADGAQPRVGVSFFISTDGGQTFPETASAANGGGAKVSSGAWHHIAGTYDGTKVQLYIDGQPWGVPTTASGAISPMLASSFVAIGSENGRTVCGNCVGSRYFKGLIDEASIYNRALSAGEIAAIYNAGSAGKCPPAPAITTPPQSRAVECGSNAAFTVTATGISPLSYQWYFGTTPITGSAGPVLSLTNIGFAQGGSYSVVVSNAYGYAVGGPAVLTVVDTTPPTIVSCPSNRIVSVGANCTAVVPDLTGQVVAWDASGPVTVTQNPAPGTLLGQGTTNLTFSVWDWSGNMSTCASTFTAADTTPPFVLACVLEVTLGFNSSCQALLPDLTTTNYVVASDNCSAVSIAQAPPAGTAMPVGTNTVVLTVADASTNQTTRAVAIIVSGAPQILSEPTNTSAVLTSNATLSVSACGSPPLAYQWQHATTNLPNATNAVLFLSSVTTNDAGSYQAVLTDPSGCTTSSVAVLTVLRPPVITRQPKSLAAVPGGSAGFSVTAQGLMPFSYQWQKNGFPVGGQTKAQLSLTNLQPQDFATYTVVVTNTDGMATSGPAALTPAVSPLIGSLNWNSATFLLTIPTEVGPSYVLECKDTLDGSSWKVLTTITGTGFPVGLSDNGLTNTARFYRIRLQ
ncbi:MAG TPA: LamG-like jellyroll fold domain-containing protein [Candidatus Acidoferrum sp.]|nr:LamG-like jellyroll fold domain-containing protein [Candidatus Acidoferrum sp.]